MTIYNIIYIHICDIYVYDMHNFYIYYVYYLWSILLTNILEFSILLTSEFDYLID